MLNEKAQQCAARSKRSKERCRNPAVANCTTCRMHGAQTPRGILSPNFRHGRRSKHLPQNILSLYSEGLETDTAKLLDLRDEICLVDARLNQILEKLQTTSGANAEVLWTKIERLVHTRRRLAFSESRRRAIQSVPLKIVLECFQLIAETVKTELRGTQFELPVLRKLNGLARQMLGTESTESEEN